MRVRSGGSGGGGGGLGAVSGGGGGEGALGGGDGFGVGQPPGGAGGGGSVQLTGGVVVLSQHHCGRGIVGVSVGGGMMMMCTYGWMMHSRCSRRPCPWRWCRSPPSGGADTSRRLRCRSSRSSRRSSPPPVPYRDGYPVPLRDHAGSRVMWSFVGSYQPPRRVSFTSVLCNGRNGSPEMIANKSSQFR